MNKPEKIVSVGIAAGVLLGGDRFAKKYYLDLDKEEQKREGI